MVNSGLDISSIIGIVVTVIWAPGILILSEILNRTDRPDRVV